MTRHTPDKHCSRKQAEDLIFDHTGAVDVDAIREDREPSATVYWAPPGGEKWWAVAAVFYSGLCKSEMIALHWLIDHANPKTGRCDPSQSCGVWETQLSRRALERALSGLRGTPFLKRSQRGHASNAYFINWAALRRVFDAWVTRKKTWRGERDRIHGIPPVKSGGSDANPTSTDNSRPAQNGGSDPVKSGGSPPSKVAGKPSNELSQLNPLPKGDGSGKSPNASVLSENPSFKREEEGLQREPLADASQRNLRLLLPIGGGRPAAKQKTLEQEALARLSLSPFDYDHLSEEAYEAALAAEIAAPGSGREIVKEATNKTWQEKRKAG
jgi:hypothetical protein